MRIDRSKSKSLSLNRGIELKLYWTDFAWAAAICMFYVICIELYYRMIVNYNDRYPSDVHYYAITTVTNGQKHDRLVGWISQQFYDINGNTLEFNIFIASVVIAIIIFNFITIRYFLKDDGRLNAVPRYVVQLAALIVPFAGPIYFPLLHEWYYMHSFDTFCWHSPTQHCMTLFSMIATLCFLKMFKNYEKGISVSWWIATMVFCLLSATSKPSFVLDFGLAIIIFFIVELVAGGKEDMGKRFRKLFIMGCTLIPSAIYILWLQTQEFGQGSSDGDEHHLVFGFKVLLGYKGVPKEVLFGITFALIVMAVNYRRFKESKYFLTFLIFITGILQWALVSETGKRANYGNFDWGRMYGNYFLTLVCLALLIENIYYPDSVFAGNKKARKIYITIALIVLAMSVLSQLNYFRLIMTGHGYMM